MLNTFQNFLDVLFCQDIIIGFFFELLASVNEENICCRLIFSKDKDTGRDRCPKKEIIRQLNNSLNKVSVYQIFADLLLRTTTIKNPREGHNSRSAFIRQIRKAMHDKGKICLRFRCQNSCWCKTVIIDQRRVITTNPLNRIRRVGHNSIKGLIITMLSVQQRITTLDTKLVIVDIMEEHVHPSQIIGGHVNLLTVKTILNDMLCKLFFGLKEEGTRTTSRVINLVDFIFLVLP